MPAATPKPTLEDLLILLSRCSGLRLNILDNVDIHGNVAELCFKFDRRNLGPAGEWVFKNPSMIFPALKDLLEFDETLEKAYRDGDPRNTIDDAIAYMEQKLQTLRNGGGLEGAMDKAIFTSTLKYLRELSRRRRDADRRTKEAEAARRKNDEEEIRRRVQEEILRREQERQRAKAEAHRRWEEEEAKKRQWQEKKTDEGSFRNFGSGNPFEEELRRAGIDPNDPIFRDSFRRSWERFGYGFGNRRTGFEDFFSDGTYSNRGGKSPPPPPNGKRKWFEILGCPPGASRDEIRRAAREAAKGLHPDTSTDPKAKEKFQEISEAKAEGLQGASA